MTTTLSIFLGCLFLSVLSYSSTIDLTLSEVLSRPTKSVDISTVASGLRVVEEIKAAAGGSIVLSGSNGTQFILTLPPKSLPWDLIITLSEIKESKFSANSTLIPSVGVQIYPDGVELAKPATLEIKKNKAFVSKSLSTLTSFNDGTLAYRPTLKSINGSSVTLHLFHFSNYLVSDDEQVQETIDLGQASLEAIRLQNWINRKIEQLVKSGNQQVFLDEVRKALDTMLNQVVIPKLLSAATCEGGAEALAQFVAWSRQGTVLGFDMDKMAGPGGQAAFADITQSTQGLCFKEAHQLCLVQHKVIEAVHKYLRIQRVGAMMGDEGMMKIVDDDAKQCLKFKFFMESDFWMGEERSASHGLTAMSEFDITFTLNGIISAAAGFTNKKGETSRLYDFQKGKVAIYDAYLNNAPMTCTRNSLNATDGTVEVANFIGDMMAGRKPEFLITGPNPLATAQFKCVDPSEPKDQFTIDLPPAGAENYFQGLFFASHGGTGLQENNKDGNFVLRKAIFRNDKKFIEAIYHNDVENEVHEDSTFIIYHTPVE